MLSFKDDKGMSNLEYGLILLLVAIIIIAIFILVGPAVANIFYQIFHP